MTTEPDNLTRKMDETLNRVAEDMHDLKERFSRFETRQAATEIVISGIHARLGNIDTRLELRGMSASSQYRTSRAALSLSAREWQSAQLYRFLVGAA